MYSKNRHISYRHRHHHDILHISTNNRYLIIIDTTKKYRVLCIISARTIFQKRLVTPTSSVPHQCVQSPSKSTPNLLRNTGWDQDLDHRRKVLIGSSVAFFRYRHGNGAARMTGHQQLVNDVKFSPDSRLIASASFDKSIKLWDGRTGAFLTTLRGHVQAVYQIAWSADSRLLVSGSADSTLKGELLLSLDRHQR